MTLTEVSAWHIKFHVSIIVTLPDRYYYCHSHCVFLGIET